MRQGSLVAVKIAKLFSSGSHNFFTNLSPAPDNFFAPSGRVEA
jgi:hypothetical protein